MNKIIGFFFLLVLIISCSPDENENENEEEVITTVTYQLTPISGGTPVTLSFQDKDGNGGQAPIIKGGVLAKDVEYNGVLTFLNESSSPAVNITEEVLEEGADHQVFFTADAGIINAIEYAYLDNDSNGKPIGLKTLLKTKAAGSGNFGIILRHKPNKNAAGVSEGDSKNAGGETDIEVSFPLEIK
jgi:hypothetical protein